MASQVGIIRRVTAALPGAAVTALLLLSGSAEASGQSLQTPRAYAMIDVTVASLWARPSQPRAIDAPSLANPVRLGVWLSAMTTAQREWLTNHLIDQGLYGQQVAIWKQRGKWDKISLTGQATSTGLSYPGWVPARQLTPPIPITAGTPPVPGPQAVVATPKAWLYAQTSTGGRGPRLLHLSFNTRLPELSQEGTWTTVRTPEGASALIASSAVVVRQPATPPPPPTGEQLVKTAEMFLRLPYLWAGTSAYGFDCSGLTYTVYDFFGIVLPRNSASQARVGRRVRLNALKRGDLVFFRTEPPSRLISHVAMYVGAGRIIESPHSGASVRIIRLSRLLPYYAGARRYLPRSQAPSGT
jgi:cell wall-associated NlpC family hydrolase